MVQAEEARQRIADAHGIDPQGIELVPVKASGDKVLDRPLADIGGKALWTKELDDWLIAGDIDFAVHSAKDVETIRPDEIAMAAILPRGDVRDALIGAASIKDIPRGATVGTSAPRRAAQLLNARPDCKVIPFRGNVATRLGKLDAGEADATFLAAAGLQRLGQASTGALLPADDWLPAPGQAAIAIECRTSDAEMRAILDAVNDPSSQASVLAERALLERLGGNCHSPVAVLTISSEGMLNMRAALFSPDGADRVDADATFAPGTPDGPTRLAAELLSQAPPSIAMHFSGADAPAP